MNSIKWKSNSNGKEQGRKPPLTVGLQKKVCLGGVVIDFVLIQEKCIEMNNKGLTQSILVIILCSLGFACYNMCTLLQQTEQGSHIGSC